MKLEIPFDKTVYEEQSKQLFHKTWRNSLRKNKSRLVYGILAIILGFYLLKTKQNFGFVFVAIGMHYLINFVNYYSLFFKSKKKFKTANAVNIQAYSSHKNRSIWEFTDEYFRYKDFRCEFTYAWELISGYEFENNNLYINTKISISSQYVIGASEIGTVKMKELISFIKNKLD